jgi:hypothetical protein
LRFRQLEPRSEDAARARIRRSDWVFEIHWRTAPDNPVVSDLNAIQRSMAGK